MARAVRTPASNESDDFRNEYSGLARAEREREKKGRVEAAKSAPSDANDPERMITPAISVGSA